MNLELGLETPAPEEKPYSVTALLTALQQRVSQLPVVWVEGEVSGFKKHSSGHWYFTLKDRQCAVSCMIWATDARKLREPPEEGMKVFAHGRLDVWPEKGALRFVIKQLLPRPEGGFHAIKREQARKALEKDGLLDPARKRAVPVFPSRIGVITSGEGAAWPDIVAVVRRRWPFCELLLIRTRVQGDEAPRAIIRALDLANRYETLDVLIVGRGGGSKEDLHAFDDEYVARAVAASRVPTISAVGHEIDITLTDLVADLRAPTPSAAAEKAVPDREDLVRRLTALGRRVDGAVSRRIERAHHRLRIAAQRMTACCESRIASQRARAERAGASLDALSPLKVLDRGYAVARDDAGKVLKRTADFPAGMPFRLRVADGEVRARSET